MDRVGRDGTHEATHQLRVIHHAVRRSLAQMSQIGGAASPVRELADAYLRDDLESLAESTRDAKVSGSALGGVAGLVSALNGVLAYSATLGDGAGGAEREMLDRRVRAIVGTIERISGGRVPADAGEARALAAELRRQVLAGDGSIAGGIDAPA